MWAAPCCRSGMPLWDRVLGDQRWRQLVVNGPLCALLLCSIKRAFLNLVNKNLPVNKTKLLHKLLQGMCSIHSRCLTCFVLGRWMHPAARPTRSGSGLSAKTPCAWRACALLENKENNQNLRPVSELVCVQGAFRWAAVSPGSQRAGRAIAAAGQCFAPTALQIGAGERGRRR